MAEKFDEFIDDVEKDMRQEKLEKVWKEYGKLISTTVVLIISIATGWVVWKNNVEKELNLTSQKFMKAQDLVERGNVNEGLGVYDSLLNSSSKTYAALARIAKTTLLSNKGDEELKKGEELLKTLSTNKSADSILRDFATLSLIRIDLDRTDLKTIDDAVKSKLIAHTATLDTLSVKDAPWALLAQEIKGIILYSLKDYTKASEIFVKIAQTKDCPRGLLARAEIMSQLILKHMSEAQ